MAGKATDRKKGTKEPKYIVNEAADTLAAFTLPDSLTCSEVKFPVLMTRSTKASWRQILEESEQKMHEIQEYVDNKKEPIVKAPFLKTECDYIKDEVFVHLLPALTETLNKANIWEALLRPKCFFNGIDHISQVLWNNNPRYPHRKLNNLHLFNMPWVRDYLKKHPRPYYPKSWLWTEDYAATVIQKTVRQYFVQREEDVQEMRNFWKVTIHLHTISETALTISMKFGMGVFRGRKIDLAWYHVCENARKNVNAEQSSATQKLALERDYCPDMATNPFLAKKFASSTGIRK